MLFAPVEKVSEAALADGLRYLVRDGVYSQAVAALTSGVLLVGYGLALGASNAVIGLLAAVPFLAQLAQLPAIFLVERLRLRRAISIVTITASRLLLLPLAFLPWLDSPQWALFWLVCGIALSSALGAMAGCSWNSWMHDLIPEQRLGSFFAHRLFYATSLTMLLGLAAGLFIDQWGRFSSQPAVAYSVLFLLGTVAGAFSTHALTRVPEPRMGPPQRAIHLGRMLREPFSNQNFRRLIWFLGAWQFATNLAAPFFTVYLVSQLGFDMAFVTFMMVVSQTANSLTLRLWGDLADRYSNKAVLRVCAPLFLLCIFLWTLSSLPATRWLTIAYLILLHLVMGVAVAGITLASGNIGLKLAPQGRGTAYLAASSVVNALAAGVAPIVGGLFADDFAARELSLVLRWTAGPEALEFVTLRLRHWDFFFLLACLLGLYALHRLSLVQEAGQGGDRTVWEEVIIEARRTVSNLSPVAGLRLLMAFPFGRIVQTAQVRRRYPRNDPGDMPIGGA